MAAYFDWSDGHTAVSTNELKLQLITLIEGYFSKHQTCERSIAISLGRQNYASALTAKISPFCALSYCIQIGVFKCGRGREGQHLSFLWTYVKQQTYCRFWRDPAFSLVFPPNWFSQLEAVWGLGESQTRRTAENLCLTPSWTPTTQPIQGWRRYHSTAGLLITIL